MTKLICFDVLFLGFSLSAQEANNVSWQFALYDNNGNIIEFKSSSEPLIIMDGTQFQLSLRTGSDVYCYIVDEQPDGTVNVLWNGEAEVDTPLMLPGNGGFFVLGPPDGTERFHIIVSAIHQKKLEKLLDAMEKGKNTSSSRQVLDEIGRLRLAQTPFAKAPEKPAVMGATSRKLSLSSSTSATATVYSGASVYVDTIRIKH